MLSFSAAPNDLWSLLKTLTLWTGTKVGKNSITCSFVPQKNPVRFYPEGEG